MPAVTRIENFWSKVEKTDTCWLWRGGVNSMGYGTLRFNKRYWLAHRFAYALHTGREMQGVALRHACDTPRCVNPAHVLAGTQRENLQDMHRKGRGRAKLTPNDVLAIRQSTARTVDLARQYHVSIGTIQRVRHNHGWRFLNSEPAT